MSHCHSSSCNGGEKALTGCKNAAKRIVRVSALPCEIVSTSNDGLKRCPNRSLSNRRPVEPNHASSDNNREEDIEREHFERILSTFVHYKARSLRLLKKQLVFYSKLNDRHKTLSSAGGYVAHLTNVKRCVDHNQTFLNQVIGGVNRMFENNKPMSRLSDDEMMEENQESGETMTDNENQAADRPVLSERSVSEFNMEKLRSTLKQFVRDWSDEGKDERSVCYEPILKDLRRLFPDPRNVEVLVPGAGLGRLAWEVARLGFNCEGNEFSLFMLFGSNFVLNRCKSANCITFYPFVHQWANNMSYDDQIRPVTVPDVDTSSPLPDGVKFSMSAGDFTEIYATPETNLTRAYPTNSKESSSSHNQLTDPTNSSYAEGATITKKAPMTGRYDCIITVFFIDTARNVLDYLDVIAALLKPGAYWINFGPLLYHHTNDDGVSGGCLDEGTIPLPYQELKRIIVDEYKFEMVEEILNVPTTYAQNNRCMLKYTYDCVKFICRKTL